MPVPTRNNYLYFAKRERRGTLMLILLILLLCAVPFIIPLLMKEDMIEKKEMEQSLAALDQQQIEKKSKDNARSYDNEPYRPYDEVPSDYKSSNAANVSMFYFDPNTLEEAGWKQLGLRDKTIATILNFRNKGGQFRQPADIQRIWGLRKEEAERLMPYIRIAVRAGDEKKKNYSNGFQEKIKARTYAVVDVNTADSNALIALPGIGSKLSQRIIHFRDKLGGFYKVEQVAETFGLPDSTYQEVKPYLQVSGPVRQININTANEGELAAHPYIKKQLAKIIIAYRQQHGNFKTVSDLKNIMIIKEDILLKMSPYLVAE
ncbi:MAG: helix-hairpin-helix domain-containing protein [Ferruginibacter sp.]